MAFIYITNGSGTEADPYLIEDVNCLKEFFNCTENGLFFKQTEDITVNDISNFENWESTPPEYNSPSNSTNYGGYDGDNHIITGLYKKINSPVNYIGGFVNLIKKIKNIKFNKCFLLVDFNSAYYSQLSIYISGISTCDDEFNADNVETDSIIKCYHSASRNYSYHISGMFSSSYYGNNLSSINKCSFKGKILFNRYSGNPGSFIAGISCITSNSFYISNCNNMGNIDAVSSGNELPNISIAGIVVNRKGMTNNRRILCEKSFNCCDINIGVNITDRGLGADSYTCIGGISSNDGWSSINDCYNFGNISFSGELTNQYGNLHISGIQAFKKESYSSNSIDRCYNYGKIIYDTTNEKINAYEINNNKSGNINYSLSDNNNVVSDNNFISLSKQEFGLVSSFTNLDFIETWVMKGGRPRLQNNIEPSRFKLTSIPNNTNRGSATGSGTYDENTEVTITAVAFAGFDFKGWSDGNKLPSRVIKMTNDLVMKAMFVEEGFGYNLLDFDGLTYFWNKIKSWFSSNESGKGASTIGIADSGGIIAATNVEGALAEVKTIADTNASDVGFIKDNFVKRSPSDVQQVVKITNGTESYSQVMSGADYNPDTQYYVLSNSNYNFANLRPLSAASMTTWDESLKYYEVNSVTGDYVKIIISSQQDFDDKKSKLYYVFEHVTQKSFEQCLSEGILYIKNNSSSSSNAWTSTQQYPNGLPHTAIINVNWGYNNGGEVTDLTTGQSISHCSGRDKYGMGDIMTMFMGIKGHSYIATAHSSPRGDGKWGFVLITFFGD